MKYRFRLTRDLPLTLRGYDVKAPAGARVELVKNASGTEGDKYAVNPSDCDAGAMGKAGQWSIFGHDSGIEYLWVPADAVEPIEE